MNTEIQQIAETSIILPSGLAAETGQLIQDKFGPFKSQAEEWLEKAKAIEVTSEDDKPAMALARTSRLAAVKLRGKIEQTRSEAKAESLAYGRAIDTVAKSLRELLEPIEAELLEKEQFAERAAEQRRIQEEARLRSLRASRLDELRRYVDVHDLTELEKLTEDQFRQSVQDAIDMKELREARAKKAEEERLAAENAERERIAADLKKQEDERTARLQEIAKLKADGEEADRKLREQVAAAQAEEDRLRREYDAEREKMLAERREMDRQAAEQYAATQAKQRREEEIRRKELKEIREAKEKAEAAVEQSRLKEQAERDAENARIRAAANAPDVDKLRSIADQIEAVSLGGMNTQEGKDVIRRLSPLIAGIVGDFRSAAEDMNEALTPVLF